MLYRPLVHTARVLALLASPLLTAPVAAAGTGHGPLTLVRYAGSALDPVDRFSRANDRCVALVAANDAVAAAIACDAAVREARLERDACGMTFIRCPWHQDLVVAQVNRAVLEYRTGDRRAAEADIDRAFHAAPTDVHVLSVRAIVKAAVAADGVATSE